MGTRKEQKKRTAPALTARSWARGLGHEREYDVLSRDAREALRGHLRVAKTAAHYQGLRDKAAKRLASLSAAYEKQRAFAEKQIAAGVAADAAIAGLEAAQREFAACAAQITGAPVVPTPPTVPAAASAK